MTEKSNKVLIYGLAIAAGLMIGFSLPLAARERSEKESVTAGSPDGWSVVPFNGHRYVRAASFIATGSHGGYAVSIVHDPDCPCRTKDGNP